MIPPVIRQELDASRLDVLSEDARDAAEEAGELDGNQHYLDLSAATWGDVAYALETEARLLRELEACDDPADILERLYEARDLEDEREALWHLELGVAAPVMALNALGGHTALSCNGGAFGGIHLRDRPSIRFYPQAAQIGRLLELARDSGVGLVEEEGKAVLYAATVQDLQRFAALAFRRYGGR
jgi:hypothetical protein